MALQLTAGPMMRASQDLHGERRNSLAPLGYGLVAISLLAVAVLLHHPIGHGRQPADVLASIRSQTRLDQVVHATLAMIFEILGTAMVLFAARLDLRRFTVVLGLVAFSCSLVLTVLAAMIDGFVIPAIAARCAADATASCVSDAVTSARLSAIQIEYLTRFSFVGVAAAVTSWSIALLSIRDVPRSYGVLGLASAACQIAALLAASDGLAPASLLMIFSAQIVWYLLAASLMILQPGPFAASIPAACTVQ